MTQWMDIPGWEGLYQASSDGEIKSLAHFIARSNGYKQTFKERILRQRTSHKGYFMVTLCHYGVPSHFTVHRLVAFAFLGPKPDGMQIAHFDGNPKNNYASNLRYDTPRGNNLDKIRHGTQSRGEQHPVAKLKEYDIYFIMKDRRRQRLIAAAYGVSQTLISQIKLKRIWRHLDAV